ncbi:MAG: hypothetical protein OXH31_02820, partial [Gammaproteobacteria bacterium]|nr:hypothetical protein [Gammaproteobacteria bacterium]
AEVIERCLPKPGKPKEDKLKKADWTKPTGSGDCQVNTLSVQSSSTSALPSDLGRVFSPFLC